MNTSANQATTNDTSATILDMETMMDSTLDSIPAQPSFCTPPAGAYELQVKSCKNEPYTKKAKDGKPEQAAWRIRITITILSTIALAAPDSIPVPDGSMYSHTYDGTARGLDDFRKAAMSMAGWDSVEGVKTSDIMLNLTGSFFSGIVTVDKTQKIKGDSSSGYWENAKTKVVPRAN